MVEYQDLDPMIGRYFGDLLVIARKPNKRKGKKRDPRYLVKCKCGNKFVVRGYDIRKGKITACPTCVTPFYLL